MKYVSSTLTIQAFSGTVLRVVVVNNVRWGL